MSLNVTPKTLAASADISFNLGNSISFDYWTASKNKECFIGVKPTGAGAGETEKFLVKSEEEFTSPIDKICQSETGSPEYIVCTANTVYIVHSSITSKHVS
jgi:hypothetical protein